MLISYLNKNHHNYIYIYINNIAHKFLKIWLISIYILIINNYSHDYFIDNCLVILKKLT